MVKYLANENVPGEAVQAARQAGHDIEWIAQSSPGADDDAVLATAMAANRILLTFDKDFGEMAFREGKQATCGVILFRPHVRSPDYVAQFMCAVLSQTVTWQGNFSVAQEGKLRVVPLPD
jgi:predicted nuclease of predicted toxin-antitoxin system